MPRRCVVFGCGESACAEKGVAVHMIPYFGDERPIARSRRKHWTDFVERTRKKWTATKTSGICSRHFNPGDYEQCFGSASFLPGFQESFKKTLRRDEHGIVACPSIYPATKAPSTSLQIRPPSRPGGRAHRQIIREALRDANAPSTSAENPPSTRDDEEQQQEEEGDDWQSDGDDFYEADYQPEEAKFKEFSSQTDPCVGCKSLSSEVSRLKNLWIGAKNKLAAERNEITKLQRKLDKLEANDESLEDEHWEELLDLDEQIDDDDGAVDMDDDNMNDVEDDDYIVEDENEGGTELDDTVTSSPKDTGSNDIRTEPKFIVFLSQLLLLFRVCPSCKADGLLTEQRVVGTMIEIASLCGNPKCPKKEMVWKSQPDMPGTRIPAGNLLLSFAILVAGASATKIRTVFGHMGLACISLTTYYTHQREKLFPSVYLHWKKYQRKLISDLNSLGEQLVVTGDARHDSMGHSAKYGVYSVFCCNTPSIAHFELVQRNEVDSSSAMEYEGFKRSMDFLAMLPCGISTFVSDRHSSVIKHMKEKLSSVKHYFDLWHLKKKVRKVLTKISKLKGFEVLSEWIQPCVNHLHWSATTTPSGNGNVILAKFKSFLGHTLVEKAWAKARSPWKFHGISMLPMLSHALKSNSATKVAWKFMEKHGEIILSTEKHGKHG